jgi:ribonuclease T2
MLPLMPSPSLIQHEWKTHGTCSGLPVDQYFQMIQKAFAEVHIPDDYKSPISQVEVHPPDIKAKFAKANPSFPASAFHVQCSGRYLSEVRVCWTKDFKGRGCSADVRDTCSADPVIMRPLR